jgi:uncharacterized membrane protein
MRIRLAAVAYVILSSPLHAASIEPLGNFFAAGISADGSAVAGTGSGVQGNRPVLWRNGTVTVLDGLTNQEHVFAQNISPDGTTIVGEDYNVIGYRWREATGYQSIPPLGIVWATSEDGNILAGQSTDGAFRWTENGFQYITTIAGGGSAESAHDISLDGSTIVGNGSKSNGQIGIVYRWTEATGAVSLGEYPYGQAQGALAMNSTGTIVVGSTVINGVEEAFRWTQSDGFVALGHLPNSVEDLGSTTAAVAVTDDGSLIVGNESVTAGATGEFAWTPTGDIQPIDEFLLEKYGLDISDWTLHYLTDMSPDGRFIIGNGSHPLWGDNVAFRISTIPEPATIVLVIGALMAAKPWNCQRVKSVQ